MFNPNTDRGLSSGQELRWAPGRVRGNAFASVARSKETDLLGKFVLDSASEQIGATAIQR